MTRLQSRNRSEEWATPVFIFFALAQSGKFLFPDSTVPSLLHAFDDKSDKSLKCEVQYGSILVTEVTVPLLNISVPGSHEGIKSP